MRPHISINVTNVKESVEFYKKIFAQNPQKQTADYAKFDLKEPALNFSMQTAKNGKVSKVSHFGIEVESADEVKEWSAKLEQTGAKLLIEDGVDCCFAIQDKVWFSDPDGNAWEVFFVHEQLPTEGAQPPKDGKASAACNVKTGCC